MWRSRIELTSGAQTSKRHGGPDAAETEQFTFMMVGDDGAGIAGEGRGEVGEAGGGGGDGGGRGTGGGGGSTVGEEGGSGEGSGADEKHQRTQSAAPAAGRPNWKQPLADSVGTEPHASQKPDAP